MDLKRFCIPGGSPFDLPFMDAMQGYFSQLAYIRSPDFRTGFMARVIKNENRGQGRGT
jgi:hypothetical protein